MADEYIRIQDAINVAEQANGNVTWAERDDCKKRLERLKPADVVSVSAYKQMMLERDTTVERVKQIGKDIREVIDDVMHLQKLLSADIVTVVRCKDCQYLNNENDEVGVCYHVNGFGGVMPKDGFCSKGERRT